MDARTIYRLAVRAFWNVDGEDNPTRFSILADALADAGLADEEQHLRSADEILNNTSGVTDVNHPLFRPQPIDVCRVIRMNLMAHSGLDWIVRRVGHRDYHQRLITVSSSIDRRVPLSVVRGGAARPRESSRYLSDVDYQYLQQRMFGRRMRFWMDRTCLRIPERSAYLFYAQDLSAGVERIDPRANADDLLQAYFGFLNLDEPPSPVRVPWRDYILAEYSDNFPEDYWPADAA